MNKHKMKILWGHKDGGPQSEVRCWGIEIKSAFSILLLRFTHRTRESYHSHAFWSISWLLNGRLLEQRVHHSEGRKPEVVETFFNTGLKPIVITKDNLHRVRGTQVSWALSFRGPWERTWQDGQPDNTDTLTHGRRKV